MTVATAHRLADSSAPDSSAPANRVRLRPVPACEPPYDDEPGPPLRLATSYVEEWLPFDPPDRSGEARPATCHDSFGRLPTSRAELPDARRWAARLIVATLETLAGRRPVQQLMPWTDDAVYAQLSRKVRSRRAAGGPGALRSLRISEPADGVVEICAVVAGADRCRAVAARMEGADGRWRCTAMQLG